MRVALALTVLALVAGCGAEPDPAAGRTRLTITHPASPTPAGHTVVFEAEGTDGVDKAMHATYGAGAETGQDVDVPLPYSKTVHVTGRLPLVNLFVQNPGDTGSVTCRVKVDGKVVGEAADDDPYGVCRVQVNFPSG